MCIRVRLLLRINMFVVLLLSVGLLLFLVGYGLYLTFGAGKEDLKDAIDEHAKMHELGIAHGHTGKKLK